MLSIFDLDFIEPHEKSPITTIPNLANAIKACKCKIQKLKHLFF